MQGWVGRGLEQLESPEAAGLARLLAVIPALLSLSSVPTQGQGMAISHVGGMWGLSTRPRTDS